MAKIDDELYKLNSKKAELVKEINELKKLVDLTGSGFGDNSFYREKAAKTSNIYLREYYNKNAMLIDVNIEIDRLNNKKIVENKINEFNTKTKDINEKLKDIEYISEEEKNELYKYIILSKYANIKTDGNIVVIFDEKLLVNTMSDDLYRASLSTVSFNDNLYRCFNWREITKKHKLFKIKPVINGKYDFVVKNEAVYARFPAVIILSKTGYVDDKTIRKIISY